METKTEVRIICEDDFELSGTIYRSNKISAAIMIAPATGIKRQFYNGFAEFLSQQGYGVLTFDNRGIGGSRGDDINAVNASLVNWGKLDMTAALEKLKFLFPNVDYHLIGHSAGGQLVGLMANAKELKSMFNFASSSGSISNFKYPFKIKGVFYLNYFIQVSNFLFGSTRSEWVGMGETLPKLVASQWSKWCNGKGYVKVDLDSSIRDHLYDELSLPSLWLHAEDDDIANYKNVKDMIRVYSKISSKIVTIIPKEYGYKEIGHMKFFSSKKKQLWGLAIDWLNKN